MYTGIRKSVDFDTNVFVVADYSPIYKYSPTNTSLGLIGGAVVSNVFNDRKDIPFVFGNAYSPYFFNKEDYHIFKTKAPFSLMEFYIGGDKATSELRTINFLHTQNITESTNAGFKVRSIKSDGALDDIHLIRMNNLSIFGHHNNKDLKVHLVMNRNMTKAEENGGIVDSTYEVDNVIIPIFNEGQNSELKYSNLHLLTEYSLVNFGEQNDTLNNDSIKIETESRTVLVLGQTTSIDRYIRKYESNDILDESIFDHTNISNQSTRDSAFYRSLKNRLYFKLRTGNQFITGGIENEFLKYAHKTIPDTAFYNIENESVSVNYYEENEIRKDSIVKQYNTGIFGDIEINISDILTLKALGNYYLFGYQQNTLGLSGRLTINLPKNMMEISSDLKTLKPDYFYNRYVSNYFIWDNSFDNCRIWKNEILIRNKKKLTGIRFNYNLLNNWLYFSEDAHPNQHNGIVNVVSAKIFGEFDFWKFKTKNDFVFQVSENENILPLPKIAIYHSLSFNQKFFDDVLHFNIGYDLHYNTKYYAYGYTPVTGVFYNQKEKKIGEYPFLDIFASIKVKRTLFFTKYEQITGLLDEDSIIGNQYYTAYHYLNTGPILRIGITWIFIN